MTERIDWYELSPEERATLTEDQVRDYCRVAAMEAGVVLSQNDSTTFLPEERPELEFEEMWVIEADDMPTGIAFRTKEDAQAFMRLSVIGVNTKYLGSGYSSTLKVIRPLTGMVAKRVEDFLQEAEYERARVALDEYGNNMKHNSELRAALEKRSRDYDRACEYIWSDYREAKGRVEKLAEVRRCWAEYQELARDKAAAVTFLWKAYDDADMVEEALGAGWADIPAEQATS